jgi:hypothetical protein
MHWAATENTMSDQESNATRRNQTARENGNTPKRLAAPSSRTRKCVLKRERLQFGIEPLPKR